MHSKDGNLAKADNAYSEPKLCDTQLSGTQAKQQSGGVVIKSAARSLLAANLLHGSS
jgi:hypothetical protein